MKAWREAHPDYAATYGKVHYQEHGEEVRAAARADHHKNRVRNLARMKAQRDLITPEKQAAINADSRDRYAADAEAQRGRGSRYYKANREKILVRNGVH